MDSKSVRRDFIAFFEERGHHFVPSAPVIPFDDPTLYFTNAGMNQFKPIFLGKEARDYKRAVNSQKCMRVSGKHNDLEEVGVDTYHQTLFEMLGNWSFGDYYKAEAIEWAWELLTKRWGMSTAHLYATVYEDDDEAAELWPRVTSLPADRVLRFGKKDNFWEMGDTGPCGPCSEIHLDRGAHLGCGHPDCFVNCPRCGRYIELWNLVFIQYNRDAEGTLHELPAKHVDTGMGFERICAVLQGKESNYDTDLFTPILTKIGELCGRPYQADSADGIAFRVIADHCRALAFTVADGSVPSNDGRGYVQRRILRRAARYGRKLGMDEPFLHRLVDTVGEVMGEAFPELIEKAGMVKEVIQSEERRFGATLDTGLERFDRTVSEIREAGETCISGKTVFELYATYGFPVDLTRLMAREQGLEVDEAGFEGEMETHRNVSRQEGLFQNDEGRDEALVQGLPATRFLGYEVLETEARVLSVQVEGERIRLVLDETPFYATSGGQVTDHGTLAGDHFSMAVDEVIKVGDVFVHGGVLEGSPPERNEAVRCAVDVARRKAVEKNHTATHLLHAALHKVVGDHCQQAGSLVAPDRLRFDFTHAKGLKPSQMQAIEDDVNEQIRKALPVQTELCALAAAKEKGAMALFGEKYGDEVRTVAVPGVSLELCGGCHVSNTGEIGYFKLLAEGSVAANIRRVEGLTGPMAYEYLTGAASQTEELARRLQVPIDGVAEKVEGLLEQLRNLSKERDELRSQVALANLDGLLDGAAPLPEELGRFVTAHVPGVQVPDLRAMADRLVQKLEPGAVVLATTGDGKVTFVCKVSKELIDRGFHAGNLVRDVAAVAGGKGGGRPDMATAGGKDPEKVDAALVKAAELLRLRP